MYPRGHDKPYNDLSGYLRKKFGVRVQKLSIDAGFTCPNRDGTLGIGGCTFCHNSTFKPDYCHPDQSVTEQLEQGIRFFGKRYDAQAYLAYFQAYTNTYAPLEKLRELYESALEMPGIRGIVIGTRPDCIDEPLLDYLESLTANYFVAIEFGLESRLDRTLLRVNRGHTWQQAVDGLRSAAGRRIHIGAHFIIGLPGETERDFFNLVDQINELPLDSVKFHHLQIIRHTRMAREFKDTPGDFHLFSLDEYIDLMIRMLERLRPEIIVDRMVSQSPPEMLIAPRWGKKNYEVIDLLVNEMNRRQTWQGRLR